MLQTMSSLLSISGAQVQKRSALPLQSSDASAAGLSAEAVQAVEGGEISAPENSHVSIFQLMLGFMLSPKSGAQMQAADSGARTLPAKSQAEDSALILPFPLHNEAAPLTPDEHGADVAEAGIPAFIMQAMFQAQRPEAAPSPENKPQIGTASPQGTDEEEFFETTAPAAIQDVPRTASTETVLRTAMEGQGTELSILGAVLPVQAEATVDSSQPVADPVLPLSRPAPRGVLQGAAEGANRLLNEQEQLRAVVSSSDAEMWIGEKHSAPIAHEQARSGDAPQSKAEELVRVTGMALATDQAIESGSITNDPERFTRMQEAAAAKSAETVIQKHIAAPVASTVLRAEVKQAVGERAPLQAQRPIIREDEAPQAAAAHADTAGSDIPAAAKLQTTAPHESSAQRIESALPEIHAVRSSTLAPHAEGAAIEMQTRATGVVREPSLSSPQALTPRAREDVFESVFREISAIKHTPASVDVTLSPESLGKVTVNVGMEDGRMSARINVQNADVRQIIEAGMPRLQDAMRAIGLALDSIAVFVDNGSASSGRRNDAPKRKMNAGGVEEERSVEATAGVAAGDTKQYGYSTVEYIM